MHECPDCGQACYCGGDIDDCLVYSYVPDCTHWRECQEDETEDQEDSSPAGVSDDE